MMRNVTLSAIVVLCSQRILMAATEAGDAAAKPSLFSGGPFTAVITILIFGLLVAVLGKYAWKPLLEALKQRETTIRDDIQNAKNEKLKADDLFEEYKQLLAAAEQETADMLKEAAAKADKLRQELIAEAQKESKQIVEQSKDKIKDAELQAVRNIYDKSAQIAVDLAGKILQREVNGEDHRVLIQSGLEELKVGQN